MAKILVRINLLKELPSHIVSGFSDGREIDIDVSYPWLPSKCATCDQFGHETSLCRRNPPSASGRKVARRSTSRRSRPSRRERLYRKKTHSREGRSRTVAGTRFITSSSIPAKKVTTEESPAATAPQMVAIKPSLSQDHSASVITTPVETSNNLGLEKEVELPFILVSHRKSGRKASSLH